MDKIDLTQIDLNARKPQVGMSPRQWQTYFRGMRMMVKPAKLNRIHISACYHRYEPSCDGYSPYYGDTLWQQYCKFINDILKSIRSGDEDYCFYIYQIAELLRYEHERLQAEWLPDMNCFKVWLSK